MHVHRSLAILTLLPALAVMLVLQGAARAQSVPTTTVSGNVYQANGRPTSGSLQISWPAFTTAAGQAVAAGRTSVSIGSDGKVSVALAPNIGAMPAGLFYTAVYHLNDGTTSTEYWVVPNTIQATIAQVRASVMPAAQAVQAVNKAYVDQSIAQAVSSQITPTGGTLTGPLYLAGDPTQAAQAANKHYVDSAAAQLLPIAGGTLSGPVTAPRIGAVLQADQFPGADFGAQLQACVNALDPAYGGTCDARNFPGQVTMAANLTLAVPNVTINLPCSTIATAASILVPGGTRNVSLHGCASRGTSAASGAQGGTVLLYSGDSALLQVGDSSFLADTKGFRLDNAALNITAAPAASAKAISFYRTQEISLVSLYVLGNGNQTGLVLDGTGNYSGGTFEDLQFTGFQAAISGIGHTVDNAATTDWLNASTFLRMHIDCPTQNGAPVAGTTGIDLQSGDGNTFTGGDVEGCATALHLGAHAVNNTLVGVRNENSTTQIQADAGSSYNNWMTGGTMYTGKLVDNGTRNSFLDTFHRSFNGVNGDWYGSQQDATVTNHYRLGIGTGSERGLQDRYQTDFGYRWTTGLSDGTSGIQYYQVLDELNHVYRLSLGQYNDGQGATNNQTVLNAAGTGAVILNGSNNAGTGGVVFGSGGPSSSTVATVDQAGNANFLGTMLVGGVAQSTGTMTVRNNADAEVDYYLWPGVTSSQKGSFTYKDFNGSSQWYMVKDQANNWALNSALGGLDSFKAYQSTNSGDTYINAAKSTGHIRLNYETGAGSETDIYSGSGSSLAAAFLGPTAIKLPGLAAASGKNCLQIDSSGYLSNTAGGCGLAATVATAGLAFSDGSLQTTSQQGALSGQANDATARSAALTAEGDAQTGIGNAATAQSAADQAEMDAQAGIMNAAAAQTSATQAETDAQSGITAAAAAQGTANAALPANGCATNPGGTLNCNTVAVRGAITTGPIAANGGIQVDFTNPLYGSGKCDGQPHVVGGLDQNVDALLRAFNIWAGSGVTIGGPTGTGVIANTTTATWSNSTNSIVVDDATGIANGQILIGVGIPRGAVVVGFSGGNVVTFGGAPATAPGADTPVAFFTGTNSCVFTTPVLYTASSYLAHPIYLTTNGNTWESQVTASTVAGIDVTSGGNAVTVCPTDITLDGVPQNAAVTCNSQFQSVSSVKILSPNTGTTYNHMPVVAFVGGTFTNAPSAIPLMTGDFDFTMGPHSGAGNWQIQGFHIFNSNFKDDGMGSQLLFNMDAGQSTSTYFWGIAIEATHFQTSGPCVTAFQTSGTYQSAIRDSHFENVGTAVPSQSCFGYYGAAIVNGLPGTITSEWTIRDSDSYGFDHGFYSDRQPQAVAFKNLVTFNTLEEGIYASAGGPVNFDGAHAECAWYSNTQRAPGSTSASFTGAISGTTLTVSGVTGTILPGMVPTGSGVTAGTIILSGSGATWIVNLPQSVGSTAMTATGAAVTYRGDVFAPAGSTVKFSTGNNACSHNNANAVVVADVPGSGLQRSTIVEGGLSTTSNPITSVALSSLGTSSVTGTAGQTCKITIAGSQSPAFDAVITATLVNSNTLTGATFTVNSGGGAFTSGTVLSGTLSAGTSSPASSCGGAANFAITAFDTLVVTGTGTSYVSGLPINVSGNQTYYAPNGAKINPLPAGSVPNSALQNSCSTINGVSICLGGTVLMSGLPVDPIGTNWAVWRDDFLSSTLSSSNTVTTTTPGLFGDTGWVLRLIGGVPNVGYNIGLNASANHPGTINLSTQAGTPVSGYGFAFSKDNNGAGSNSQLCPATETFDTRFIFQVGQAANERFRIGFANTSSGSVPPTYGMWLRFDTGLGDTNYTFEAVKNGVNTGTVTATAVAGDSGTWHNLEMVSTVAGTVQFILDGGAPVSYSTNIPSACLIPVVQLVTTSPSNVNATLDFAGMNITGGINRSGP